MAWFDFSDLVTDHFNMQPHVNLRFFDVVNGAIEDGVPQPETLVEMFFASYSFVPRAPKDFYTQLTADKREREYVLVWTPVSDTPLKTVKLVGQGNASRVYDVMRNKLYVCAEEWPYARQGNLAGTIAQLIDEVVPTLPDPPV
jgi:hypothetical protein